MKAILIDPVTQTVTEVIIDKGLSPIYEQLGNGCGTFECPFTYNKGNTLYCDEEGLYHENIGGFMYNGWNYPIVGRGLVIGTNFKNGDSKDVSISVEEVKKDLVFIRKENPSFLKYIAQF